MRPGLAAALASYAIHQRARAQAAARLAQAPPSPPRWRFHDEAWLGPDAVDLALLFAPRWNPHAAAFYTHPIAVQGTLEVDLATAAASAALWSVTVRRLGQGPVAWLGPGDLGSDGVARVTVAPGPYQLDGRYYEPTPHAAAPRVRIDGDRELAAAPVPLASLDAARGALCRYQTLRHRVWAHHAVWVARWAHRLPEARARSVLLPAADPTTRFTFGPVERGERLTASALLSAGQRGYLTVYNAASFPVWWGAVGDGPLTTASAPDHGLWIGRAVGPPGAALPAVVIEPA